MSGFVGIINFDGAPVDPELLDRMTRFLAFRGPDAQQTWIEGNVGLGHTLFRTTFESEYEHQPFSLDRKTWIIADARVDARAELVSKLQAKGDRHASLDSPDVELLWRAYRVWGKDCVQHLLGDFAFAVWDSASREMFCARDQMGVKPFFYAFHDETLIVSNTLDCIRLHPKVSDKLNELAVADFLMFGLNQDLSTTTFSSIQRIPPAHQHTWSSETVTSSRYWSIPIDEPVYYRRSSDYVDRFREILRESVKDRLRVNGVGVSMSGGLDSPTLAAQARECQGGGQVYAFTTVLDGYDQNEGYFAKLAASYLQIPIEIRDGEHLMCWRQ